ncbi:MAG: GAF domain-containing protein [Anaerolineae bacterium]|nr:GAF domain-containing protein [Anaerolineae bacterium]
MRQTVLLSLIAILALLAFTGLELWGTWQDARQQLDDASLEANRRFEDFLSDVQSDLGATGDTLPATRDVNQVFSRMLGRQPAIFELTLVQPSGQVLAQRRRVGTGEQVLLDQPWLEMVQAGDFYVGLVDYAGFGVPFVNLAVGVFDSRDQFWSTLVARVDLTSLWDQVAKQKVGETGYVYVTDTNGQLLVHPELRLALRGATLDEWAGRTPQAIAQARLSVYQVSGENLVVGTATPLDAAPWYIIVEQGVGEVLRPFLWRAALPILLLVVVGGLVYNTVRFVRYHIAHPLDVLREGVDVLRRGELMHRIDITTRDEWGALADTFNEMSSQLQGTIATLEERVQERTRNLWAAADVSHATTSVLDPDVLMYRVVDLVLERFDLYYVGVFLLDETGQYAVLRAGTGEAGQQMLAEGHRLLVGGDSMIGQCVARSKARIALDVGEEAVRFDNPWLPETCSELALPLRSRGRVVGAMSVQSVKSAAFDEADITVMQTMADQVAVAIDNARLFAEAQAALQEAEAAQRRYLGRKWAGYSRGRGVSGYRQTEAGMVPLERDMLPEARQALTAQRPVCVWPGAPGDTLRRAPLALPSEDLDKEEPDPAQPLLPAPVLPAGSVKGDAPSVLVAPVKLRGQPIGVLGFEPGGRPWRDEDLALVEAIAEQMALAAENLWLLDETQDSAAREQLIGEVTARMRQSLDLQTVLETAADEMHQKLGLKEIVIRLAETDGDLKGDVNV